MNLYPTGAPVVNNEVPYYDEAAFYQEINAELTSSLHANRPLDLCKKVDSEKIAYENVKNRSDRLFNEIFSSFTSVEKN